MASPIGGMDKSQVAVYQLCLLGLEKAYCVLKMSCVVLFVDVAFFFFKKMWVMLFVLFFWAIEA